jgi:hypothetical protein
MEATEHRPEAADHRRSQTTRPGPQRFASVRALERMQPALPTWPSSHRRWTAHGARVAPA